MRKSLKKIAAWVLAAAFACGIIASTAALTAGTAESTVPAAAQEDHTGHAHD